MLARIKAGQKGAASIDVEHFVTALILEDQGKLASELALGDEVPVDAMPGLTSQKAYFSPEAASKILQRLESLSTPSEPIPSNADLRISEELQHVFSAAIDLSKYLKQSHTMPLHLVAAVLSQELNDISSLLKQTELSKDAVIAAIHSGEFE